MTTLPSAIQTVRLLRFHHFSRIEPGQRVALSSKVMEVVNNNPWHAMGMGCCTYE